MSQERRNIALDAACRISSPGEGTSGVLSRARQVETYLETGIVRSGDKDGTTIHVGQLAVTIFAPPGGLTVGMVKAISDAITEAVA